MRSDVHNVTEYKAANDEYEILYSVWLTRRGRLRDNAKIASSDRWLIIMYDVRRSVSIIPTGYVPSSRR